MSDTPRHGAPQPDSVQGRHTLTVRQVETLLSQAGVQRSHRHVLRLCQSGMLDAVKVPGGPSGDEWYIEPASVPKAIGDLKQIDERRARRGTPQPAVSGDVALNRQSNGETDTLRHGAPDPDTSAKAMSEKASETQRAVAGYVTQLEKRIEEKDHVIGILKEQLDVKDKQITQHNDRERETNVLIRGLQNLVLRLQPGSQPSADVFDHDPTMNRDEDVDNSRPVGEMVGV